jgi:hypothetical protein
MSLDGRSADAHQLLVDYLLGALSEDETERLDELSIADEEFAWRLNAVENDLVDGYVRGELPPAMRERFQVSYLLSEERRNKVAFAEAFAGRNGPAALATEEVGRVRGWREGTFQGWQCVIAGLLLQAAAGFVFYKSWRLRRELVRQNDEVSRSPRSSEATGQTDFNRGSRR